MISTLASAGRTPGDPTVPDAGNHGSSLPTSWQLDNGPREVSLGRDPSVCWIHLPHPTVSRTHAKLKFLPNGAILSATSRTNPVLVDGVPLRMPFRLQGGERITIGPFDLYFQPPFLTTEPRSLEVPVAAKNVTVRGRNGKILLSDVSFTLPRGRLTCLIGPSGCGKSTLLKVLAGQLVPVEGQVSYATGNMDPAPLRCPRIVVLPQRDVFHEVLTPRESLGFSARLLGGASSKPNEVDAAVDQVLRRVGLLEAADLPLHTLSGGQRKRAALARGLLSSPDVLMLDEVTSGLDELADAKIMALLASLSLEGRTILCVTHQTANIESHADCVGVLTVPGRLAFLGTAGEALDHFGIPKLAGVYECLNQRTPDEWHAAYRASRYYSEWIAPPRTTITPKPIAARTAVDSERPASTAFRSQSLTILRRSVRIAQADLLGTMLIPAQAVFIAAMIALVFPLVSKLLGQPGIGIPSAASNAGHLLFAVTVACYWLGCSQASKELIRERAVIHEELRTGMHPAAYLAAKLTWLAGTSTLQAILLYCIVCWLSLDVGNSCCQLLLAVISANLGMSTGLVVSAYAPRESVVNASIPPIILLQILFCGALRPLAGPTLHFSQCLVSTHSIFQAMLDTLPAAIRPVPSGHWSLAPLVFVVHLVICVTLVWRAIGRHNVCSSGELG